MWKILKILGHLLKAIFLVVALLALTAITLLYIFEHGLPTVVIDKIEEKISTDEVIVDIGRITFHLESGLHLHNIEVYPKKIASERFGTVEDVIIRFSINSGVAYSNCLESITLKNINCPHHPRKIFRQLAKMKPPEEKKDEPRKKIPTLSPFKLIIEDSHVIGFKAKKASTTLTLNDPVISFSNINLQWADTPQKTQLDGHLYLHLDTELLDGYVKGEAFPENVTGFLKELEAHTVIREIAHFSKLKKPIDVDCNFEVNLNNSDFTIDIDLDVKSCAYRNIPLNYARGNIKAYGTNNTTWVDLKGLKTANSDGSIEGTLYYDETDESLKVNAISTMRHRDVTGIIDILTHGELNPVICEKPPIVTANGVVAISTNALSTHRLTGSFKSSKASIFGLNVKESSCDYAVQGDEAILKKIKATTLSGGTVKGSAVFTISIDKDLPPAIVSQATFHKIDLSDLAQLFSITNERIGECSGNLELASVLGTNQLHTINGKGDFKVKNGRLNQLKLFAGLTEYMSKNIPGISSLVNQSECSFQFTIKDGILSTDNFDITGDIFNIHGKGTYDIPNDNIDLTMHVALFRRRSIAGRITRFVTFPFKKLLLEFKLYGTSEDPQWSYVTILEKIVDQIPGPHEKEDKKE
ncbi:MAG: hypothetical protein PF904_09580 [Kiritimatiellae bacterium]|jgi:hypothetical protein|nr:hypothetical protein [Kiritimatiellia bacterium]